MEPLYHGSMSFVHAVLYILLGLIFCFTGYGVFRTFLRVYGLLLGFFIGLVLGALSDSTTVGIIAGIAGGFLGCVLIPFFYFVGLFLTGGMAGALLLALPIAALELPSPAPELGAIMAGFVLGGILAVRYEKAIMVVLTSLYGVAIAGMGLNGLGAEWLHLGPKHVDGESVFLWSPAALVVRIVLLIAGFGSQYAIMKRLDKKKPGTEYW